MGDRHQQLLQQLGLSFASLHENVTENVEKFCSCGMAPVPVTSIITGKQQETRRIY